MWGLGAITVCTAANAERTPTDGLANSIWPNGAKAAVSLTYDDGLDSQLDHAGPQLDEFKFKATFFVTRENMEARLADWVALAQRGHEIADLTVHHPCKLDSYSARSFASREIDPMEQFLEANFASNHTRLFAYPCGILELGGGSASEQRDRYLRLVRNRFLAARGITGDPNYPREVLRNLYDLHASAATYDQDRSELAINYVRKALRANSWAILIFHDVVRRRSAIGETNLSHHREILRWIAGEPLWCAPMGHVLSHITSQTGKSSPF
jgi:peptidoglycan/xylan/chitin deacetylase (PgdA/CDA1 family)